MPANSAAMTLDRPVVSPETRRLYTADWGMFEAWCRQAGRIYLPANAATVADFLTDPAVRAVLRGARRSATPRRPKPKTAAALTRLAARCPGDLAGIRDRALLLLAASGLDRAALVGLDVEPIRFTATAAEFSPAGGGPAVVIHRGTNRNLCPVQALEDWLATSETRYGPVFRKVDRWGVISHQRLGTDAIRRILLRREPHRRAGPRRQPRPRAQPVGGA